MKNILLILFLMMSVSVFGQERDTISNGDIVVYDFGNNSYEHNATRNFVINSRAGVVKGDRIFKVPATAPADTIATLLSGMNANDILALERGGEWRTSITVPTDSISFCAYGTGAKPILNGADIIESTIDTTYSAELFAAGTFDDATGWTLSSWHDISGGEFSFTASGSGSAYSYYNSIFSNNTTYYYEFECTSYTSGSMTLNYYVGGFIPIDTINAVGTYSGFFTITEGDPLTGRLYLEGSVGDVASIDNLSIKEATITGGGWNSEGGNVYSANCPSVSQPIAIPHNYVCIIDGVMSSQVGSLDSLDTNGEYYVDLTPTPDKIYIYSATDPASSTVEVSGRWSGVVIDEFSNITVSGIEAKYFGHSGIFAHGKGADKTSGNSKIINCNTHHNRLYGVMFNFGYSNSTISYCEASYNGSNFYFAADELTANSGSNNNTFSHCASSYAIRYLYGRITDGHGYGIYDSDNCIVEYCTSDYDFSGIVSDPAGSDNAFVARYNKLEQNTIYAILVGGNTGTKRHDVYYNQVINGGRLSDSSPTIRIVSANDNGGVHFYNNTIYQTDAGRNYLAYISGDGSGVNLKNNLWYSSVAADNIMLLMQSGVLPQSADNNLYYTSSTGYIKVLPSTVYYLSNIEGWRTFSGLDSNSVVADPLFTNAASGDLSLQTGSPAINAGVDVGLTKDINGNSIVGTPDIGAFEKQD